MSAEENEKLDIERSIERARELLLEYPEGSIHETMRDYIADLERQLRDLDK